MAENKKSNKFTPKEIESGKGMAVLSYIIALIPYFAEKNNKYVRFHAIQGMNIFLVAIAYGVVNGIITSALTAILLGNCTYSWYYGYSAVCAANAGVLSIVTVILSLIGAVIGVISIIGIVNAATGKAVPVPLLGKIKIIKK